jgi:hypothetical protein
MSSGYSSRLIMLDLLPGAKSSSRKASGGRFNCLATYHQVMHCRDPARCWKCKASGHISPNCRKKRFDKAPDQPFLALSDHPSRNPSSSSTSPRHPLQQRLQDFGMERRPYLDVSGEGASGQRSREARLREMEMQRSRGSAVNYPGNPHFRPRVAFKLAPTSVDMEDRKEMLAHYAVVVTAAHSE